MDEDVHSLRVNIVDMTIDGKRPDRRKRRSVPVDVGPNNIPAFLECELDSLLGGQGDNSGTWGMLSLTLTTIPVRMFLNFR